MAMERLTKSPYVVNIFGSCGPSVINEFADFVEGVHNFRDFAKQMRNKDSDGILRLKLNIAAMIAMGVQDIHEIDGIGNATMVHYDINPMNVAITFGGIPKLNDFNVAEFIQWDNVKNKRTHFVGRLKEPWWRAPEEMQDNSLLDGKLLEIIFYFVATTFNSVSCSHHFCILSFSVLRYERIQRKLIYTLWEIFSIIY